VTHSLSIFWLKTAGLQLQLPGIVAVAGLDIVLLGNLRVSAAETLIDFPNLLGLAANPGLRSLTQL